jgi:hypothetical protein
MMNSIMARTTIMIEKTNVPSSIPADGTQASSNDRQAASAELTPLDAASMRWVAGGPTGSIGIIGR